MKNKILITLAMLSLVLTASAQVGPTAITLSTNRVTAATTNSTASTGFFVGNEPTVQVLLSVYSTNAASAGGVGDTNGAGASFTLRLAGSFDNVTFFENGTNWDVVYLTTGTNAVNTYRQLDSSGVQYFRQNKLLSTTTNLVLFPTATYFYK